MWQSYLSQFHLTSFRRGQEPIIQSILLAQDTLAVMPTGGGKSLCYQLPALHLKGLSLVISPLIALMKDQVLHLKKLNILSGYLYAGQSIEEKRQIFSEIKWAQQNAQTYILYMSPERVQSPGFAPWIVEQNVQLIAIDEAHCISQWGPDFREDYHKLSLLRKILPRVPILALTATATQEVLGDIGRQLHLRQPAKHVYGFYRPNLYYQIEVCEDEDAKLAYLLGAVKQTTEGKVLIYCGTRKQTEQLADWLSAYVDQVSYYHAGLSTELRNQIQDKLAHQEIRILCSTNAFGMGVDYSDVRLVVHFQMPANIESFYQEMGRAGRDGLPATCLLLYAKKDKGLHSFFIQRAKAGKDILKRRWEALDYMVDYIESEDCRHAGILTYFKDTERLERCGHCDVCLPTSVMRKYPESLGKKKLVKKLSRKKKDELLGMVLKDDQAKIRHDKLKDWRKSYAHKNDMPVFLVFSNKTLVDLANKNPQSLTEMENVYGLGPMKISQLGQALLQCLRSE